MNTEENKRSKGNLLIFIICILYVSFLILYVLPKIRQFSGKFISPEEITYYDSIDRDFILLKDEVSFNKNSVGTNIGYEEGTRLGYGVVKAAKTSSVEYLEISKKIQEIDRQIAMSTSDLIDTDRELRKNIIRENYVSVKNIVDTFVSGNISNNKGKDRSSLEREKQVLQSKMNALTGEVIWNPPGLISYSMDGFENFSTDYINEMSKSTFEELINKPIQVSVTGDFKIVDNFKAIVAFYEPNSERFKEMNGKRILFSLDGYKNFYEGRVLVPDVYESEGIVGIEINSHIEDIYKIRRGVVSCVFDRRKALKIPTNALLEYEGDIGVLSRDVNGIIVFRPVEILNTDNQVTIIASGDERGLIGSGDDIKKTLVYYEELVTEPDLDMLGRIYRR